MKSVAIYAESKLKREARVLLDRAIENVRTHWPAGPKRERMLNTLRRVNGPPEKIIEFFKSNQLTPEYEQLYEKS